MSGYFGSKATSGLCQAIISMMPPHTTYIETHLGGGAIMQRKAPCAQSIGIDIDSSVIENFKCNYPVELTHGCAHEYLKDYPFVGTELVYCDPPYLLNTRTSERRYRFDYEEKDHTDLLGILRHLPCKVMISGYDSELYNKALKGWQSIEIQVMNQGGVRTEKVWFNFMIDRVHWAKYAGKNFTDRQRIKRKAVRWGANYKALPQMERLAVMAAMMDVEREESELRNQ
jgi:DNA adenine methylase